MFMGLTCRENLRLGRGGVEESLALMPELDPLLDRKVGLMSGGEQQMLTLARALAGSPKVLLADELTLGLAPLIVARLLTRLRAAADRGIGVLIVEERVKRALRVADRVCVLRRGEIVMEGTAAEMGSRLAEIEASYLLHGRRGPAGRERRPPRMNGAIQLALVGMSSGSLLALTALGIVIAYRGSGSSTSPTASSGPSRPSPTGSSTPARGCRPRSRCSARCSPPRCAAI